MTKRPFDGYRILAQELIQVANKNTAEQYYGFDRHVWDLTVDLAAPSRKITLAISICYLAATGLTKISILFFYRRIGEIRAWFRWTLWVCMAFIVLYTIAFTLAIPFECHPLDAYWNKANPLWTMTHDWHCINEGAKMVSAGAISAFQDVVACILPMALFWDLRMSRQAKIALAVVFSLGLFTCVVSVIRTVKIYHLFFETYDVTWAARWAFSLTVLEVDLGLICASMPALKNKLQRMLHVIIDPFTLNSLKASGRWRNPFFASYQKSWNDYFGRGAAAETSQAQSQGTCSGEVLAKPASVFIGTRFTTFSLMTAFADGLAHPDAAELELGRPSPRQEA
ncbi:integral membrane protein [Neofusicoccum parvum]|nr:integral membrane protein [Neofusicoccum parvum]